MDIVKYDIYVGIQDPAFNSVALRGVARSCLRTQRVPLQDEARQYVKCSEVFEGKTREASNMFVETVSTVQYSSTRRKNHRKIRTSTLVLTEVILASRQVCSELYR